MGLYLFSGFLGSGKTTIVIALAKFLFEKKHKKVMLIVNDVGDIGIDAQLMRKLDADVYELFGGCICGQMGNFIKLLKGIGSDYDVDTVLMEASGMAQPERFIYAIEEFVPADMKIKTVAVVDAVRWLDLIQIVDQLLISQIVPADMVLVNKVDVADAKTVEEVITSVRDIKDGIPITTINANNSLQVLEALEVFTNE